MKLIKPESLLDIVLLDDVRVSPDGTRAAFVRNSVDVNGNSYARTIWIKELTSNAPAEPFTSGTKDSSPKFSADGLRLGFLSGRGDKTQVFALNMRGGEARSIAAHDNGIGSFEWSPDGKRVAFTASLRADERDEEDKLADPKPQDSGTAHTNHTARFGEVFDKKQKKEKRDYDEKLQFDPRHIKRFPYRTGTSFMDGKWAHIYVTDVPASFGDEHKTDHKPMRVTDGEDNYSPPSWTSNGDLVSTYTRTPNEARWYMYHDVVRIPVPEKSETNEKITRTFTRLTGDGHSTYSPKVSPDGNWIAFERFKEDRPGHRNQVLALMDTNGGEVIELTAGLDRSVEEFKWSDDGQFIYFTLLKDGNVNLWRVNIPSELALRSELARVQMPTNIRGRMLDYASLSPRLANALRKNNVLTVGDLLDFQASGKPLSADTTVNVEQLTMLTHDVQSFDVAGDGRITFVASTVADPSALYVRETDGSVRCVYKPNHKFLDEHTIGAIEAITFPSDEFTIQGWILKPPNFESGKKYPLVLQMHGGPHVMWTPSTRSIFHEFQAMAAAGYVVFFCNPRGSDGYGENFTGANWKDWGHGPTRDVLRGVDEVVKLGFVDDARMVLTGGSYAGYLAAWIIGHDHRFKAACSQRGVYNLISMRGTTDIPLFNDFESGYSPYENVQALWDMSPIAHVPNMQTPLLIEHSEQDYRVPIEQGEQLFSAMKLMDKTVEMVRWPREGHELSRTGEPRHRVERIARMMEWFERYTE